MGLASALAAQQAAQQGGSYPPQQPQQPMMQQQYPMQPVQQMYPTPAPAPPQPQQNASPAGMQSVILARLDQIVKSNELEAFYTKQALDALAQKISQNDDFHQLAAR